jgi:hypothetical protein
MDTKKRLIPVVIANKPSTLSLAEGEARQSGEAAPSMVEGSN